MALQKTSKQVRREFIDFFVSKGHKFIPSSPVVPADDPTLLFTNAGMNQFKSIFLGEPREGLTRAANSQKCMRVSGKHNDLEEVGVDHYHHTFFEMLGNWSFGDYYKKEAIAWAWELLTEVWKLPKGQLYATVYKNDDEAEELWKTLTDIDHAHISRHGEKDNFWEMGETGPCGPCTEIHIDLGEGTCPNVDEPGHVCEVNGKNCHRFMEIWNNVFMQYNREKDGSLKELPAKHVDTGMGFERVTRIINGLASNYDTDVFRPIISIVEKLSGKAYDQGTAGIPHRVIADHIRSLTFAITDGAFPSNDGRGYVLRRLLRRAYRFGHKLGFNQPFLYKLVPEVVAMMGEAFPEIAQRADYVAGIIKAEEERFGQTLEQGIEKFNYMVDSNSVTKKLPGADVFMLYDTYGFPMDLTRLMASEIGYSIDEDGFTAKMAEQRDRARQARKNAVGDGLSADGWVDLFTINGTEFVGYHELSVSGVKVSRYKVTDTGESLGGFKEALVILDRTPFYAESGGQVGDTGAIITANGLSLAVIDTIKWNDTIIHKVSLAEPVPTATLSETMQAVVNDEDRASTRRHHSATHLLQAALIKVLGTHVQQSGSKVEPSGLRFDFSHFKALSDDEISSIETIVNTWVMENSPISTNIMNIDDAKRSGAMALFGEKYGDAVRVVSMGEVSKELCGGTHAASTGEIGLIRITAETSISAGIRRIEAVAGTKVLDLLRKKEATIASCTTALKVNEANLPAKVADMALKMKEMEASLAKLSADQGAKEAQAIIDKALAANSSVKWAVENAGSLDKGRFTSLNDGISDAIKSKNLEDLFILVGAEVEGKAMFAAAAGKKAVAHGIHCGDLVKAAATISGGGGGGSPTRASAGGKNPDKIGEALKLVTETVITKAK